jgi:putative flippase GtrA
LTKRMTRQVSIYLLGGILSAVVDIGVIALLLHFDVVYQIAVSAGFVAGLTINFVYHAQITFVTLMSSLMAARYLIVVALNYGLTIAVIWLSHHIWGQPVLLGKILSLPIVAASGFLLGRLWIFTARPEEANN